MQKDAGDQYDTMIPELLYNSDKNTNIESKCDPDRKLVDGNYLRMLAIILAYDCLSASRTAIPSRVSLSSLFTYRSYVNVYLCIKQALFIRPMNMHCLLAVARCRVQTRRYHCLINHTQSHRTTLRIFSRLALYPVLITPRANSPRTRRVIPPRVSPQWISTLSLSPLALTLAILQAAPPQ